MASPACTASRQASHSSLSSFFPHLFPRALRTQTSTSRPSPQIMAAFSTSAPRNARKKEQRAPDRRIKMIRYNLYHPALPRPLRLSRNRSDRHWTIHRAWQLFRAKQRHAQEQDLQNLQTSMSDAMEALRLIGDDGITRAPGEGGRDQGKLFRVAMGKQGVGRGAPIEYARAQTEFPGRAGWNYAWTR